MAEPRDLWRAKTDEELIEASQELSEYTEEGERIIRAELRRRGLAVPPPPISKCPSCGRSISGGAGDECAQCGEPYPPDILRALGAVAAQGARPSRIAKTSTGESLTLVWEDIRSDGAEFSVQRAKILGGWLVCGTDGSVTFVPDAEHRWTESYLD
jgi:hypothetical protein